LCAFFTILFFIILVSSFVGVDISLRRAMRVRRDGLRRMRPYVMRFSIDGLPIIANLLKERRLTSVASFRRRAEETRSTTAILSHLQSVKECMRNSTDHRQMPVCVNDEQINYTYTLYTGRFAFIWLFAKFSGNSDELNEHAYRRATPWLTPWCDL